MSQAPTSLIEEPKLPGNMRRVVTPEGVPLHMTLAPVSARAMAFFVDMCVILAMLVGVMTIAALAASVAEVKEWAEILATLSLFLLRNFYFTFFELRWRGQTPGKKLAKLRVVDARGGALVPSQILVRNLTREIELFLPIVILIAPDQFWPGAPYAAQFFAASWSLILLVMPFLNSDRLRIGDLMGGTMVMSQPKVYLYEDVGRANPWNRRVKTFSFSSEQLDMYGVYELQVLESFLRQSPTIYAMEAVVEKITVKIGWKEDNWRADPRGFLQDFYEALRNRREQRMLFGDVQQTKKEGTLQGAGEQAPPNER